MPALLSLSTLFSLSTLSILSLYSLYSLSLSTLSTLSSLSSLHLLPTLPLSLLSPSFFQAARGLQRKVFASVGPTNYITFQDFADWYTVEGHTVVPWLELLDINKWPHENGASSGGGGDGTVLPVMKRIDSLDGWDMEDDDEEEEDHAENLYKKWTDGQ